MGEEDRNVDFPFSRKKPTKRALSLTLKKEAHNTALQIMFLLLSLLVVGVLASDTPVCPTHQCGKVKIRYPFWIDTGDAWHCGHPSLRLECRGRTPVLRLPSGEYAVTDILYGDTMDGDRRVSLFDLGASSHSTTEPARSSAGISPSRPAPTRRFQSPPATPTSPSW